jgi:hypothetical protein
LLVAKSRYPPFRAMLQAGETTCATLAFPTAGRRYCSAY